MTSDTKGRTAVGTAELCKQEAGSPSWRVPRALSSLIPGRPRACGPAVRCCFLFFSKGSRKLWPDTLLHPNQGGRQGGGGGGGQPGPPAAVEGRGSLRTTADRGKGHTPTRQGRTCRRDPLNLAVAGTPRRITLPGTQGPGAQSCPVKGLSAAGCVHRRSGGRGTNVRPQRSEDASSRAPGCSCRPQARAGSLPLCLKPGQPSLLWSPGCIHGDSVP